MAKYEYFIKGKKVIDSTMMSDSQVNNMILTNICNELARIADIMRSKD